METSAANPIKILIVEDYEITRAGIKLTLEQISDFKIVGEVADGETAVDKVQEIGPHVVLMDIGLPGIDGIETTARIKAKRPETRIIMLTSHNGEEDVFAALGAGADGYCLKEVGGKQLVNAIRAVFEGVAWLDAGIASKVLNCALVVHHWW